ncbi:hypothetical protein CN203_23980 [Sinorhizobium meliloti]|nr:hypothetical protein CN203_23980 [Sinorhizobium meliloti]
MASRAAASASCGRREVRGSSDRKIESDGRSCCNAFQGCGDVRMKLASLGKRGVEAGRTGRVGRIHLRLLFGSGYAVDDVFLGAR